MKDVVQRLSMLLPLFLAGCEPANPPPEGWVESCYGGSFSENLNGSLPEFVMTLKIAEDEWPELRRQLFRIGEELALDTFDSSLTLAHVRTFEFGICSADGLSAVADGRIYVEGSLAGSYDGVRIAIHTYRDSFDWVPLADALAEMAATAWSTTIDTDNRRKPAELLQRLTDPAEGSATAESSSAGNYAGNRRY